MKKMIPSPTSRSLSGIAAVLVFVSTLLLASCRNVPVDPVKPSPGTDSTKIPKPGGSLPPDSTGTKPPRDSVAVPRDSVTVFKTLKITYSADDFQQIQYDAAGNPVRYVIQYQNNAHTGGIARFVYDFTFGADRHLKKVTLNGTSYFTYFYEGDRITRVEEFNPVGERIRVYAYQYAADNRLRQVDIEDRFRALVETRYTYEYDPQGNLRLISDFAKSAGTGAYTLSYTFEYAGYSQVGKHVENLLAVFPFLPGVTFRVHNYTSKIVRDQDGGELSRETYTYAYDEQGRPTQRVTRNSVGSTLTGTYSY